MSGQPRKSRWTQPTVQPPSTQPTAQPASQPPSTLPTPTAPKPTGIAGFASLTRPGPGLFQKPAGLSSLLPSTDPTTTTPTSASTLGGLAALAQKPPTSTLSSLSTLTQPPATLATPREPSHESTTTPKTIKYITKEEATSFVPSGFDDLGRMLDNQRNIVEIMKSAAQDEAGNRQNLAKKRPLDRDTVVYDEDVHLEKGNKSKKGGGVGDEDRAGDELVHLNPQPKHNISSQTASTTQTSNDFAQPASGQLASGSEAEVKKNPYDFDQSQQTAAFAPRRRGLLGKSVDIDKLHIHRNYELLTQLKMTAKQAQKKLIQHDEAKYGCFIDYKNIIFGLHYFHEEDSDEHLSICKDVTKVDEIAKLQVLCHPFENATFSPLPSFSSQFLPSTGYAHTMTDPTSQIQTVQSVSTTTAQAVEWWDLKLLSTGTLCQNQFQTDILAKLTEQQVDDEAMDDRNEPSDPSLVFLRPKYPPFNPTTSTFCCTPGNPTGLPITTNLTENPSSDDNSSNSAAILQSLQSSWPSPLSQYVSANVIPPSMFVPKYLAPISTIAHSITKDETTTLSLPLTRKELQKERKIKRAKKREEEELLIKAGVMPKRPQKVRLATLYRQMQHYNVMGLATEFEKEAKKQIQERITKHVETNLQNMLTPEEIKAKRLRKLEAEKASINAGALDLTTVVYRVGTLNNPKTRKDIMLIAKQQRLTGSLILCRDVGNVVIVQGGPRGLKKFGKYVQQRAVYQDTGNIGANFGKHAAQLQEEQAERQQQERIEDEKAGKSSTSSRYAENGKTGVKLDKDDDMIEVPQENSVNDSGKKEYLKADFDAAQFLNTLDTTLGRSPHHDCVEIWNGNSAERTFDDFYLTKLEGQIELKAYLKRQNIGHFYDLIRLQL